MYILCKIARSCNAVTQCDTGSQSEVSILYPNKEYKSSKSYKRNPIEYFITQPSCVYTVENTEIPSNSWMEKLSSKRQKYHRKRDGKIYKKKFHHFHKIKKIQLELLMKPKQKGFERVLSGCS